MTSETRPSYETDFVLIRQGVSACSFGADVTTCPVNLIYGRMRNLMRMRGHTSYASSPVTLLSSLLWGLSFPLDDLQRKVSWVVSKNKSSVHWGGESVLRFAAFDSAQWSVEDVLSTYWLVEGWSLWG